VRAHHGLAIWQAVVLPRGVLGRRPQTRARLFIVITLQDTKCATVIKGTFKDGEVLLKTAEVQQERVQAWRSHTESKMIACARAIVRSRR